ncbi:carbohydrate-binding module family 19 protein [Lyophyllum atratum]|nr:carbohydrate-binding module family 19 protein [Lyophyllum atratum]
MSPRASAVLFLFAFLAVLAPVRGAPTLLIPRHEGHDDNTNTTTPTTTPNTAQKQNGLDAQQLNVKFASLKASDACQDGEMACVTNSFAQCVSGKWAVTPCAAGIQCVALPLVNKPGTSIVCDSNADALARFAAAGVQGGITGTASNDTGNTTDTTTDNGGSEGGDDCEDDNAGSDGDVGDDEECDDEEDGTTTNGEDEECDDQDDGSTTNGEDEVITVTVTATPTAIAESTGSTILLNVGKTASAPPSASSSAGDYAGYKRQLVSSASPSGAISSITPVTVTVIPSSANTAVTSVVAPTVTVTVAPTTQVNVPTSVSAPTPASSGGVEPTAIVIGADGIRTVTVVSTVTVGCGATSVAPTVILPSSSPVSSSAPIVTLTLSSTATPSSVAIPSSSVVVRSSSVPASSSSGSVFTNLPSASATASSATGTSTPAGGRGGFSFSTAPSPTPAPQGGVNNGSGKTMDLSELLTATVA